MRRCRARTLALGLVIPGVLSVAACTGDETAEQTTPPPQTSSEPSPTARTEPPAENEAFAFPDSNDPAQVAIFLKYDETQPSGRAIAGPATLIAERPFFLQAQCEGRRAAFEVLTAEVDPRVLIAGDIDCDAPPNDGFTYQVPYTGPVQVRLTEADDVRRAWVKVSQPQ